MEINDLIDLLKEDLDKEGSYDRYPVRFMSMKCEKQTSNEIIKIKDSLPNVEIFDLKDLLEHDDAWITSERLRKEISLLDSKKSFIIVGFSEYARFLTQSEFISLILSLLEIENRERGIKRRIYVTCFALYNQLKKSVKQYHKRFDAYNPFINEDNDEELQKLYFVDSGLNIDVEQNGIYSSSEWFKMWRNSDINMDKPTICFSPTLAHFYTQASPDNIYNIQRLSTYQDVLTHLYNIKIIRPYQKDEMEFYKKLISIVKDEDYNDLGKIILKRLNTQSISSCNIYSLWVSSDLFNRWLIQNYILIYSDKTKYLYHVFVELDEITDNAFVEKVYGLIMKTKNTEYIDERKMIINDICKVTQCFEVPSSTKEQFKQVIENIIKKETLLTIEGIDFTMEDVVLKEQSPQLIIAFQKNLFPFITCKSIFERRLIVWMIRMGFIDDKTIAEIYPQMGYYLDEKSPCTRLENIFQQLDDYFDNYRKCRIGIHGKQMYSEKITEWNESENTFFNWYFDINLEYPEMMIKQITDSEKVYVLDGVGAEFMGYILKLLHVKGYDADQVVYAKSHLPSITSKAKEVYTFDNEWIDDFDRIVNHGELFYPVENIEKALFVIENIVDKIISNNENASFVITSDHGATVGHKIDKKDKMYNFEKAEHDGRCFHNKEDKFVQPSNDYASYSTEDDEKWIIALNQRSLFNTSKYCAHGGATPEETVIPLLYVRKGNVDSNQYYVKAVDLKVSGLHKEVEVTISPEPKEGNVILIAKDGTNTTMQFDVNTKSWKGNLERGIEQDIKICIGDNTFEFRTIPTTKMGDDLFDD